MKKIKFLLIALVMAIIPSFSLAANFLFSPAVGEYQEGQTFDVSVFVEPAGKVIYTAKIELKYPANLLEIKSFTFGANWMPLSQPGYDSIDNTTGTLIKSGGYPGGLSNKVLLGVASFHAKTTGLATVETTKNSLILDDSNQDIFSDPVKAFFTLIEQPAPALVEILAPKLVLKNTENITGKETLAITGSGKDIVVDENEMNEANENTNNLASIKDAGVNIFSFEFNLLNTTFIGLLMFFAGLFIGRKTSLFSDYMSKN